MKILVLGGIAESKLLTQLLIDQGHQLIYSIVGMVRKPELPCPLHMGGFSDDKGDNKVDGATGLAHYLIQEKINLLIDATHPYATEISKNAACASQKTGVICWRLERPGWNPKDFSNWHDYDGWPDLLPQIKKFQRPFFSIGKSALQYIEQKPQHQNWIIRSALPFDDVKGVTQINAIGPFDLNDELSLLQEHKVDALISKNSGCTRVIEKLNAADQLGIPVFVQRRPELSSVEKSFNQPEEMVSALQNISQADLSNKKCDKI